MSGRSNFIIYNESPTQLLNSLDYLSYKNVNINTCDFFFRVTSNSNYAQINEITRKFRIGEKIKIIKSFSCLMMLLFSLLRMLILRKNTILVLGDFRSKICKCTHSIVKFTNLLEVVYVDDGLYILNSYQDMTDCTIYSNLSKFIVGSLEKRRFVESKESEFIEFGNFHDNYILGSKISEIGYISEHDYISIIALIKNEVYDGKQLVYYPHRGESPVKLERIKSLGLNVIAPLLPVEMFFEENGLTRGDVISFYSTALANLKLRNPLASIIALDLGLVGSKFGSENIRVCYKALGIMGVKIKKVTRDESENFSLC